jgi:hypothetical protein
MLGLLAAAPVSLLIFFAELGVRPDVMTAMHNPFFDLKFAVTIALAISAIAVSLHLSRPEASLRGFGWWLLVPAGISSSQPKPRSEASGRDRCRLTAIAADANAKVTANFRSKNGLRIAVITSGLTPSSVKNIRSETGAAAQASGTTEGRRGEAEAAGTAEGCDDPTQTC